MSRTGDITSVRFSFASFGVNKRYRDVTTVQPAFWATIMPRCTMREDRQLRRAKLAEEIPRRRSSLSVMKFAQDRLLSPMRERRFRENLIQKWTEELERMEAEYHELNVELIREELKGGQFKP